jgi:membrane-associated phospholipid phosphatase
MSKILNKHKDFWSNRQFFLSMFVGLALLILSLILNYYAGNYATQEASNSVTDIILNNIPVYNVSFIFIYGVSLFFLFLVLILLNKPKRLPFVLKASSIFVIVRSFFIMMTHIGPFPQQISFTANRLLESITFGGDLFFSGHTGIPFLMALIFWQNKKLRYIFLTTSVIFAVSVLLGHLHYTIDVFAAYFITYTIFVIAKTYFKKDYGHLVGEDAE